MKDPDAAGCFDAAQTFWILHTALRSATSFSYGHTGSFVAAPLSMTRAEAG
ncbi:MAG: hypothetical protein ACP5EP_10070 [Acidobacteriaceae bacterium]